MLSREVEERSEHKLAEPRSAAGKANRKSEPAAEEVVDIRPKPRPVSRPMVR